MKSWEWQHGGREIMVQRDVARDRYMFKTPTQGYSGKKANLHTGEVQEVVTWQWPGDERVFLVPAELFHVARLGGLVRDLVSAVGQLYRDQGFPAQGLVTTSYRKIAELLCLSFNGRVADEIEMCFAYARCFTIQNHPIIVQLDKTGKVKRRDKVTFGFIDYVARTDILDGKPISKNRAPVTVAISRLYAAALRELPPVPFPVTAFEAAHRAPWRIQDAVKNMAYHLAGRVPCKKIRLMLSTIQEILNRESRPDKTRKTADAIFKVLSPAMIRDFNYVDGGYDIYLSGKKCKSSKNESGETHLDQK